MPRLGNYCMVFPDFTLGLQRFSASDSILRRRKEEWFRLQRSWRLRGPRPILFFVAAKKIGSACRTPLPHGCSDSGFQGSNLAIATRKPSRIAKLLHRFLISGPDLRIDAAQSSWRWRIARLQHRRGVQAGACCYEGGIILSKKPPE